MEEFYNMRVWYKYEISDSFTVKLHEHMQLLTFNMLHEYYVDLLKNETFAALRIEYERED